MSYSSRAPPPSETARPCSEASSLRSTAPSKRTARRVVAVRVTRRVPATALDTAPGNTRVANRQREAAWGDARRGGAERGGAGRGGAEGEVRGGAGRGAAGRSGATRTVRGNAGRRGTVRDEAE